MGKCTIMRIEYREDLTADSPLRVSTTSTLQRFNTSEQALCRKVKVGDVIALQERIQTIPRPSQQELADYLCIAAGFGHPDCVRFHGELVARLDATSASHGSSNFQTLLFSGN